MDAQLTQHKHLLPHEREREDVIEQKIYLSWRSSAQRYASTDCDLLRKTTPVVKYLVADCPHNSLSRGKMMVVEHDKNIRGRTSEPELNIPGTEVVVLRHRFSLLVPIISLKRKRSGGRARR